MQPVGPAASINTTSTTRPELSDCSQFNFTTDSADNDTFIRIMQVSSTILRQC